MRSTIQIAALLAAALPAALSAPLPKAEAQLVDGLIEAVGDVVSSTIYQGTGVLSDVNEALIKPVTGDASDGGIFDRREAKAQLEDVLELTVDEDGVTIYDGPEPVTNANVAGIIKVVGDLTAEDLFGKREAKAQLEDVLETAGDLLDLPNVYDWVDDEVVPGVTEIVDTVGDFDLFGRSTNN